MTKEQAVAAAIGEVRIDQNEDTGDDRRVEQMVEWYVDRYDDQGRGSVVQFRVGGLSIYALTEDALEEAIDDARASIFYLDWAAYRLEGQGFVHIESGRNLVPDRPPWE